MGISSCKILFSYNDGTQVEKRTHVYSELLGRVISWDELHELETLRFCGMRDIIRSQGITFLLKNRPNLLQRGVGEDE